MDGGGGRRASEGRATVGGPAAVPWKQVATGEDEGRPLEAERGKGTRQGNQRGCLLLPKQVIAPFPEAALGGHRTSCRVFL